MQRAQSACDPAGGLAPNNRTFRRRRAAFLLRHPICTMCRRDPATVLDHIIPHRGIPRLFWNVANWQGLCFHCHGVKTARETWQSRE